MKPLDVILLGKFHLENIMVHFRVYWITLV